ncbi:MAG: TusE/DsrC/DsvC family sulfur relay protein [Bacteroidales bacterium]|jgi:tRNA 2-thiouridine synthesizing protein E|nr:TusE/DsrC/DsvC family sulfur relay protein [Bacteroidales bacterium]
MAFYFNEKQINMDGDGFMLEPQLWNDDLALLIAKEDDIQELTENHWSIIRIIRHHYEETGMAPMIRSICKETGLKLKDIYELFPLGPARGACRVAGLPKPDGCV